MKVFEFNDLIIDLEAKLLRDRLDKELLIKESFILWYILVEGIYCESFTDATLRNILIRNVKIYQSVYTNDADFDFMLGWMTSIAFWYFEPLFTEEDGVRLLKKAYKHNPKNSLFKWAFRMELGLRQNEIENLKIDIALRYDQFYNYGDVIKEYFLDII